MRKINKLALPALLAMALLTNAGASPTSTDSVWSWSNLFVNTYKAHSSGDIHVSFETSAGTLFTAWNNSNGVNQCPTDSTLRLASAYQAAPEIQKALLAAGLARKALHVWFEATAGICYIKQVSVTM
jgi:hypothetical protein